MPAPLLVSFRMAAKTTPWTCWAQISGPPIPLIPSGNFLLLADVQGWWGPRLHQDLQDRSSMEAGRRGWRGRGAASRSSKKGRDTWQRSKGGRLKGRERAEEGLETVGGMEEGAHGYNGRRRCHIHTHAHACTCTHSRAHAHTCAHEHTHVRVYTHIHTHTLPAFQSTEKRDWAL